MAGHGVAAAPQSHIRSRMLCSTTLDEIRSIPDPNVGYIDVKPGEEGGTWLFSCSVVPAGVALWPPALIRAMRRAHHEALPGMVRRASAF